MRKDMAEKAKINKAKSSVTVVLFDTIFLSKQLQ